MAYTDGYSANQLPTDIFGLKYRPTLEPKFSDDDDSPALWLSPFPHPGSIHITPLVGNALREWFSEKRESIDFIMEIGVDYPGPNRRGEISSTRIMLNEKKDSTVYLGIDKGDRSDLSSLKPNVHTMQIDSISRSVIRDQMRQLGINRIDFLFIDGWHSVNMMINDWIFAEMVPVGGRIAFHDVSWHPGPYVVYEAINETLFKKNKVGPEDWGIALLERYA